MTTLDADIADVSDTALWVATYRAQESERPDALFRDPLARVLAGERGKQIAKAMEASRIMSWFMVVRTTAIDRLIMEALQRGVDTVLNLGAGLDTRPYRMPLPKDLLWVEVDFPKMIQLKNDKLKAVPPVCRQERVALDLSQRAERRKLLDRYAAQSKSMLVITEGVVPYLPPTAVGELADDLLATKNLDYWIQDYHAGGGGRFMPRNWRRKLKAAPLQFIVKDWFGFFADHGWKVRDAVWAFDEARRIGRTPPIGFPWLLVVPLLPRRVKRRLQKLTGFVTLERA